MLDILLNVFGIILFFAPGTLLSFILFNQTGIVERLIYSLALSIGFFGIIAIALYYVGLPDRPALFLVAGFLILILFILLFLLKKKCGVNYSTTCDRSILFIVFFSLLGTAWRYFYLVSIKNFNDPYEYAFLFLGKHIPDLGSYAGMVHNRSPYIGNLAMSKIFEYININFGAIDIFCAVFLSLGLIFLIFKEYRADNRLACLGVALMAMGPVEIFYSDTSIWGNPLSYALLLLLFLVFKSNKAGVFWIVLPLIVILNFTYYTATVIMFLASFGFLAALLLKDIIKTGNIGVSAFNLSKEKKFYCYLAVFMFSLFFILFFSNMIRYDIDAVKKSAALMATPGLAAAASATAYQDPVFLGLSAIRWQMLFFLACGSTFVFYMAYKKKFCRENIDLLLCLIPVTIVSAGFLCAGYPARIFDYFAFFGLLVIQLPKKSFYKLFFALTLAFIAVSGYFVAKDKKIFLEMPESEALGAAEIKNKFSGKIFSDEVFINQLLLSGFYDVAGAEDNDPIIKKLFYQKNKNAFLEAIGALNKSGIPYIAITERMREGYVLMVNYPQKAIYDFGLYKDNLKEVYNEDGIEIFSTLPAPK